MSDLKIYKEIGEIPIDFGSNSIYAMRTGPGFDLYMTDTTGSVAYKINNTSNPTVEEAADISSFTTAFNLALNQDNLES